MSVYLESLPEFEKKIKMMMHTIITNIVLLGQVPAPTRHESARSALFLERLSEFQVDECTTDDYGNPIGIIRGNASDKPPIFVVAHMDTPFSMDVDHHFSIKQDIISGPGLLDNSLGIGVLASLPEILRTCGLRFESDLVLAGPIHSIGKGNLHGVRHLLRAWPTPIRGAVCMESGELGRLNYYSDGMTRCEIICHIVDEAEHSRRFRPNAILVLNEVINHILELRLPLRPRAKVIFGTIRGGFKHGEIALEARLGLEIRSDSDEMVKCIYNDIRDIVSGVAVENEVSLKLKTISNVRAARLKYNHPLVKSVLAIMRKLNIQSLSAPDESELSIFLSRRIPAVTLGLTHGEGYQQIEACMFIEPMFKGIAQVLGTIWAIDCGVCDE